MLSSILITIKDLHKSKTTDADLISICINITLVVWGILLLILT